MKCMKSGGNWPPGKGKIDKSCKKPPLWGNGGPDNSPNDSRSGQQAGSLGTKPQFDRSRIVKPDKPSFKERREEKKRLEAARKRDLRPANPRFL